MIENWMKEQIRIIIEPYNDIMQNGRLEFLSLLHFLKKENGRNKTYQI